MSFSFDRFEQEFKDIPEVLKDRKKYLDCLELGIVSGNSSESWSDISTASYFKVCEGDQMVNWKKGGYSTILDILMVFSELC